MSPKLHKILMTALITTTIFGAMLRLFNLDLKEFWHDECETALVLSGLPLDKMWTELAAGPVDIEKLAKYQKPGEHTSLSSCFNVMQVDEPGHVPLFYFLEYLTVQIFGASVFGMRLLPALLGIAQLPIFYLLTKEIYESKQTALFATAVASLSPTLIYFSQEARDYSLEFVFLFLSSLLLLRALRLKTIKDWMLYTVSLTLGFYSSLFLIVVAIGHIAFIVFSSKLNFKQILLPFTASLSASLIFFSPWLWQIDRNKEQFIKAHAWLAEVVPLKSLIQVWCAIPCKTLALYGSATDTMDSALLVITICLTIALLAAVALSFQNKKLLLPIAICFAWIFIFAAPDASTGGIRSVPFRHQTPVLAAILLMIPAIIHILGNTKFKALKIVAILIALPVLAIEIHSSVFLVSTQNWPNKSIRERYQTPAANIINTASHPEVMLEQTRVNSCEILALTHVLRPDTTILAEPYKAAVKLPSVHELYLFNPSPAIEDTLSLSRYRVHEVAGITYLKRADRP